MMFAGGFWYVLFIKLKKFLMFLFQQELLLFYQMWFFFFALMRQPYESSHLFFSVNIMNSLLDI